MGVPAFFRWLCCRNPKFLWDVQENPESFDDPSVNPAVDNLYLDMNGIIHPCSHPEVSGIPIPVTLNDMFINVFNYVDRLVDLVRPRSLIYMAIDGVAPRAKMNQQRARRFRAAQESERASQQKSQLRDNWATQGLQHPAIDEYISNSFDSNQITPGTEFMQHLTYALQYYIYERLNNHPLFKHLTIIFSDASVPGEGEHKILQFIRDQRQEVGYNPNTRHCLYGADADLIMLGLSTHEPWFYIIRETVMPKEEKLCTLCQQRGHFFHDCRSRQVKESDFQYEAIEECDDKQFVSQKVRTIQVNFQMMKLYVIREWMWLECASVPTDALPFGLDLERIVDDFVFMCFLVGNDFLPHIPALKIVDGGIDCLIVLYKQLLPKMKGYLTNCHQLNLHNLNEFLIAVASIEDELIRGQHRKHEISRQRRENDQQQQQYQQQQQQHQVGGKQAKRTNLVTGEVSVPSLDGLDQRGILEQFKKLLSEKLKEVNQIEMSAAQAIQQENQLYQFTHQIYYTEKFHLEPKQFDEFKFLIRQSYIESLAWTLNYYYKGCVDWGWYYPFHYAPFAQDLRDCQKLRVDFEPRNQPLLPFQQLLGVLPPRSRQFLPDVFHELMLDQHSPIIDFYPIDFFVDLKGKKFAWLGEVVLPFIDAGRLIDAHDRQLQKYELPREDQARNRVGNQLLFTNTSQQPTQIQGLTVKTWERFPVGSTIKSPMPTFPDIPRNQVISHILLSTQQNIKPGFVQNSILEGCLQPALELDEHYMRECDNSIRSFGGEAVKRIISNTLGLQQTNYQQRRSYQPRGGYNNNRGRRGDLNDISEYDQRRKQVRTDQRDHSYQRDNRDHRDSRGSRDYRDSRDQRDNRGESQRDSYQRDSSQRPSYVRTYKKE